MGGIFSVVPELLLILVEFPVTIFLTWFFCCYMIYHSFLGFLFNLMFYPILFIGGVIGFLFLGARWAAGSDVLVGDYQKWIEITDDSISSYKGKKIPIREAYRLLDSEEAGTTRIYSGASSWASTSSPERMPPAPSTGTSTRSNVEALKYRLSVTRECITPTLSRCGTTTSSRTRMRSSSNTL